MWFIVLLPSLLYRQIEHISGKYTGTKTAFGVVFNLYFTAHIIAQQVSKRGVKYIN